MERLSGKLLIDTYSKRSQTLMEKGKELEKLTGAYVIIYTARPESIVYNRHRDFISDNLRTMDAILASRISGALKEIDGTAIKVAGIAQPAFNSRKKARITKCAQTADVEQQISSLVQRDASLSSEGGETNVYAKGVEYENALGAASARGQETVVRLLLDHGAGINARWGDYGTALHAASMAGHII